MGVKGVEGGRVGGGGVKGVGRGGGVKEIEVVG